MNTSIRGQENASCHFSESTLTRTLKTVTVLSTGACGIFGNVFIIILAIKFTLRRNLHHLIINMAMADTTVVLATFLLEVPRIADDQLWMKMLLAGGDALCQVLSFFLVLSIYTSFLTLFIISFQRFRATRFQRTQAYTPRKRAIELASSWVGSFGMSFIRNWNVSIKKFSPTGRWFCSIDMIPVGWEFFFYLSIAVTVFLTITLSGVTLKRLARQKAIEDSLPEVQRQARAKRMASAIKMVIASLLLFTCCYTLFISFLTFKMFCPTDEYTDHSRCTTAYVFEIVEVFLPLVNSCFSPVIYLVFLSDFREAAKGLVYRRIYPRDTNQEQQQNAQASGAQ